MAPADMSRMFTNMCVKTKMCKFEAVGKCAKGVGCPFAHNIDELNELPDLRCTKMCKLTLARQECNIPGCPYAHSKKELRAHGSVGVNGCSTHRPGEPRDFVSNLSTLPWENDLPRKVRLPPGLDIETECVFDKRNSNGPTLKPWTVFSKPHCGMDVPRDQVHDEFASNEAVLRLGSPKYVQLRRSCAVEGEQFRLVDGMCSQIGDIAFAPQAGEPVESNSPDLKIFDLPYGIGDYVDSIAGIFGTGNDISTLLSLSLKDVQRWSSESTQCSAT